MTDKLFIDAKANASCDYHRLVLPFQHLKPAPKVPVFIFNRVPSAGVQEIAKRRAAGYKIVADVDDYWVLHPGHYLHHQFTHGGQGGRIAASLAQADVVLVTNLALADRVRGLNPNIVIVPNALPYDQGQFSPGRTTGGTAFVYAAGPSHFDDVLPQRTALNTPDLTLAGVIETHHEWRRIRAQLPKAPIAREEKVDSYMRVYDGHAAAIAPLADTEFNRCKSNLKALEAGAKRIPLIASRVHPYWNGLDRDFILFADTPEEWQAQMDRCRRDPELVRDAGQRLGEHVRRNYSLAVSNEIRRQVIESFV